MALTWRGARLTTMGYCMKPSRGPGALPLIRWAPCCPLSSYRKNASSPSGTVHAPSVVWGTWCILGWWLRGNRVVKTVGSRNSDGLRWELKRDGKDNKNNKEKISISADNKDNKMLINIRTIREDPYQLMS
ncbi:hypothetical protein B0H13DRAFT_1899651 [Mycena leptocephala]|nr:hypothetical protein B0H13DRAFT_1899651 [Mycena leptocephala]